MTRDKKEIIDHYVKTGAEQNRLKKKNEGRVEEIRTKEILKRFLPKDPAVVCDIGGGAGVYSFFLAEQGHKVHMSDLVELHIEQAKKQNHKSEHKLQSLKIEDARSLSYTSEFADALLLLGPLYHLTDKRDRIKSLKEAYRVLKQGGMLFVAAISRYASMIDGLRKEYCLENYYLEMLDETFQTGINISKGNKDHFTTAYFHKPDELKEEIEESGFQLKKLLSIEGVSWTLPNLDKYLADGKNKKILLELLKKTESESSLLGYSPHIMAIAVK